MCPSFPPLAFLRHYSHSGINQSIITSRSMKHIQIFFKLFLVCMQLITLLLFSNRIAAHLGSAQSTPRLRKRTVTLFVRMIFDLCSSIPRILHHHQRAVHRRVRLSACVWSHSSNSPTMGTAYQVWSISTLSCLKNYLVCILDRYPILIFNLWSLPESPPSSTTSSVYFTHRQTKRKRSRREVQPEETFRRYGCRLVYYLEVTVFDLWSLRTGPLRSLRSTRLPWPPSHSSIFSDT